MSKVKMGMKVPKFAKITAEGAAALPTYDSTKIITVGEAVSGALTINRANAELYSDDGLNVKADEFSSASLALETDGIEDDVAAAIYGAAVASGIGQIVGACLPLIYFLGKKECSLKLVKTGLKFKPLFNAVTNGSSELLTNISSSVVGMLFNYQLLKFLGENGVAAYGTIMYVQFIFNAVFIGYSIGVAPIISYNYGAENHEETKNVLKKSIFLLTIA